MLFRVGHAFLAFPFSISNIAHLAGDARSYMELTKTPKLKTGTSHFFHKKISTHLLTVLTISVILQLEQRKGDRKRESGEIPGCVPFQRFQRNKVFKKKKER